MLSTDLVLLVNPSRCCNHGILGACGSEMGGVGCRASTQRWTFPWDNGLDLSGLDDLADPETVTDTLQLLGHRSRGAGGESLSDLQTCRNCLSPVWHRPCLHSVVSFACIYGKVAGSCFESAHSPLVTCNQSGSLHSGPPA